MPDLLLELRSEEIPARMQRKAAGDLKKLITDGLVEAGLTYEGAREYWTPRRLTLDIRGLTARSKDVREEIKGPGTKAPEQAVQGFLRKAGLSDISQAQVHSDPKKGDFYVAVITKAGRAAEEIIAELVPSVIRAFPWPKSMRWGPASAKPGGLRWVRPLQSILCTFGPETEEPAVVNFEVGGIRSGNVTYGHRFHAPEKIAVRRFDDYVAKLEKAKVILDAERRKQIILDDAKNLTFANGLELVEDEGLLEEVSGLVEWPVVLMGEFEEAFLDIPPEVVRLTIRANQKCFVTRPTAPISPLEGEISAKATDEGEGRSRETPPSALPGISPTRGEISQSQRLSNRFILTANIEAHDGGAEIAHGNGKVVRARLSDALYFWNTDQADLPDIDQLRASAEKFDLDLAKPLDQRMARLDHLGVTFHAKLGTQGERVERIRRLAEVLAPIVARSISPSSGASRHLLPDGEKREASMLASSPQRGEGGSRSEPGEGDIALLAARAAVLAKADLTTEIVGEFPELQGAMGRKYALLQGEHASVAAAIEEHYKPQGPADSVPVDPMSIAVALADKLDTLVGFWAIDEKPTGSKDPYALRRAALGVIRILVENGVRLEIRPSVEPTYKSLTLRKIHAEEIFMWIAGRKLGLELDDRNYEEAFLVPLDAEDLEEAYRYTQTVEAPMLDGRNAGDTVPRYRDNQLQWPSCEEVAADLLSFFHDRLKVYLRDKGMRHDLIDAVLAGDGSAPVISPLAGEMSSKATEGGEDHAEAPPSGLPAISPARGEISQPSRPQAGAPDRAPGAVSPAPAEAGERSERAAVSASNDDLLQIVRRVEALSALLETDAGRNLLAGTKRAANILAAEEKKGTAVANAVDPALLKEDAEKLLFEAVDQAESKAAEAIRTEDFSAAMRALSALREPIDSFFEKVLVNDEDAEIRANRLALLSRIRAATGQVADFSRIAG